MSTKKFSDVIIEMEYNLERPFIYQVYKYFRHRFLWSIWRKITSAIYFFKCLFEKMWYGTSHSELYSLDMHMAKYIFVRLVRFKEHQTGGPTNVTEEEWKQCLDDMIEAFSLLKDDRWPSNYRLYEKRIKKGLNLFAKYYTNLWI